MAASRNSIFLQLPLEIRLKIYRILFNNIVVVVQPVHPDLGEERVSPRMKAIPLSAQVLRVCKQVFKEGQVQLYSNNVFDCSLREGVKLLLQNIGPENFSIIRHVRTDWDELQGLSWALAKDEYQTATAGLCCLEIAKWRTRISSESAFLWMQVKAYERQLYQSAFDICQKHSNLHVVAERKHDRTQQDPVAQTNGVDVRVKWRFVPSDKHLVEGESIVQVESELNRMNDDKDDGYRERNLMIDAF